MTKVRNIFGLVDGLWRWCKFEDSFKISMINFELEVHHYSLYFVLVS